jgi:hypothetical protein
MMRALILCVALTSCALAANAAGQVDASRNAVVATQDPLGESVTKVVYLDQNWSPDESNRFYFTAQGSQLIPYEWFLALEQVDSTAPFLDTQNILKYRYLPQRPGPLNPDGLPVGFVGDAGVGRKWLGMTCAACHTTEIRLGTTAYRIDGAPTHGDIQGFLTAMISAMQQTLTDPARFTRFAAKVLGADNTSENQVDLKGQLAASIKARIAYNLRNFPGYDPQQTSLAQPTHYGRLDAVDSIVNEVYHFAVKNPNPNDPTAGAKTANAPVSYPFLWDTPQHDLVEWLGIAKSGGPLDVFALSRNVGEVIGVFGEVAIPEVPGLLNFGYSSTIKVVALTELESQVKTLWSPQWPADFPKIDPAAAAKGAQIYKASCVSCHDIIDRRDPNRKVVAFMGDSKTDPQASINFFSRTGPSGKLNGVNINFVPFTAKIPPIADADTMLSNVVIGTILGQTKQAPPDELNQVSFRGRHAMGLKLTSVSPVAKYKARPLNGIWATAPYLHNGSVPNLDALLRRTADRPKSFTIGARTFDPVRVGYMTNAPDFPMFNVNEANGTPITGNSNAGHEDGANLSEEERSQLIEYLKTL